MKIYLSLLLSLLFTGHLAAQQVTVTGTILDENNTPIPMGNAIALSKSDSSLITGTYFKDGQLNFSVKQNDWLLRITALGYSDLFIPISTREKKVKLGERKMQLNNTLEMVEITETLPLFDQKDGNVTINVDKTMLSASSNVNEILSKSPGVIDGENDIQVVGKGKAILFMGGKRISYDRLKSIPVDQIKAIKVISNPDAKYDAEGQAIIEIVLKENNMEGHQASVLQHFTKGYNFLSYTALSYDYQKAKFSLSTDYSINVGKTWSRNQSTIKTTGLADDYTSSIDYSEHSDLQNVSTYRVGLGYKLNPKTNLTMEYNGNYSLYGLDVITKDLYHYESGRKNNIFSRNDAISKRISNAYSLNAERQLDSAGSYLFFGSQFSQFNSIYDDVIRESNAESMDKIIRQTDSDGDNSTQIAAGQLDWVQFVNGLKLEMGTKYSAVESKSNIDLFSNDLVGTKDRTNLNKFQYNENIAAGYFQVNGKFKKIGYMAGVRAEHSTVKGKSISRDSVVVDSNYLNLFPTFKLEIPVKAFTLSQSLSSRIERPGYQSLDPFQFYINRNMSVNGNPYLTPALTWASETKLSYKVFSLTLGYAYTKDPMRFFRYTQPNGNAYMKLDNFEKSEKMFLTLNLPAEYKFWNSYNSFSVENERLTHKNPEFKSNTNSSPKYYLYSYNQFKVKDWFNLEVSGEYISPFSDGFVDFKDEWFVSVGASRFFLDNKLMVRLLANDIFHTSITRANYAINNTEVYFNGKRDTFFFRFLVKYTFGKLKQIKYKNVAVNQKESGRVK